VDRDHVGALQQVVEGEALGHRLVVGVLPARVAVPGQDEHAEGGGDPGHRPAVAAQAEDAQGPPCQGAAHGRRPLAGGQLAGQRVDAAQHGQHEAEGQLRDRRRGHPGPAAEGDHHPAPAGRLLVDVVGVAARLEDQLQVGQPLQQGGVDPGPLPDGQQHPHPGQAVEVALAQRPVEHGDLGQLAQPGHGRGGGDPALVVVQHQQPRPHQVPPSKL
jgi:hypothetical protein